MAHVWLLRSNLHERVACIHAYFEEKRLCLVKREERILVQAWFTASVPISSHLCERLKLSWQTETCIPLLSYSPEQHSFNAISLQHDVLFHFFFVILFLFYPIHAEVSKQRRNTAELSFVQHLYRWSAKNEPEQLPSVHLKANLECVWIFQIPEYRYNGFVNNKHI